MKLKNKHWIFHTPVIALLNRETLKNGYPANSINLASVR